MFGQTILVSPKLVADCTTVVVMSVSISYQGCTILLQSVHPLMLGRIMTEETGMDSGARRREESIMVVMINLEPLVISTNKRRKKGNRNRNRIGFAQPQVDVQGLCLISHKQ